MRIHLALAQFASIPDRPARNLERAARMVGAAARAGADLIAFPEEFLTGALRRRAELADTDGRYLQAFSSLAREHRIDIQAGTWYARIGGVLRNAAYYFDRDGHVRGEYFKNHLWHGEKGFATPGSRAEIFDTRFGRVGLAICWDLFYPETFRAMFERRAVLALVPALWSREDAGPGLQLNRNAERELVDAAVTTRACENQMLVAFVNGAGRSGKVQLIGRTQVSAPFHGSIARLAHNREQVLQAVVDTAVADVAEVAYRAREDYRAKGHRCASISGRSRPLRLKPHPPGA